MASADDRPADSSHEGSARGRSRPSRHALEQLEFELEFFGKILERDPFYADALKVHASNLAARGQLTRALQADRRLVGLQPERPIPWYNLACSYAVLGMNGPALWALQRAVELGYRHVRHLLRDPDLKSLRRDPRFAKILRKGLRGEI
jgi:tetratricopeptide (TPR) repeat protein